jgi:hypothetical protein
MAVFVCRKCKGHECVVTFLAKHTAASVKTVRCQKVCKGPVAGVKLDGRWEWFGSLKRTNQLEAVAGLTEGAASVPKPLQKCRSRDRSGCPPR